MRVRRPTLLALLAPGLAPAAAFAPARPPGPLLPRAPAPLPAAGPPVIREWRFRPSTNTLAGIVTNHPSIPDGDRIATSAVRDPAGVDEDRVVTTTSGSKYRLANAARGGTIPAAEARRAREREGKERERAEGRARAAEGKRAAAEEKKEAAEEKKRAAAEKKRAASEKKRAAAGAKKEAKAPAASKAAAPNSKAPAAARAAPAAPADPNALRKRAKSVLGLTGATVGPGGKYLLAGRARQSNGRAARIWTAYVADPDVPGVPAGFAGDAAQVQQLTIKLSPDVERLKLENANYDKVQKGLFSGRFVRKMEYLPKATSNKRDLEGNAALVIEAGRYDLKALLAARRGLPLRGRALRDIAVSAGQCVQAVHSSRLVWTDLKTENFIVVADGDGDREADDADGGRGLPGVKGIDLESVIRRGGNPIDYSPEACPPEFARAFVAGEGGAFVLDYSYDMWSLGMMLYEVATGRPYFDRQSPREVTKRLCDEGFEVDVGAVPDEKLRDLIGRCLSLAPRRRPDITGFLLHPYFLTTGFGPLSF